MNGFNPVLYLLAFALIWVGSGLTVNSIERIAKRLKMNTFIVSFVILGIFTTLPEIFLAVNSTVQGTPEISAGNLLGGIIVLFLLLIPLIAIAGKGAKIIKDISQVKLFLSAIAIILPTLFLLDGYVGGTEGLLFLAAYTGLIFFVERDSRPQKIENKAVAKPKKQKRRQINMGLTTYFGKLILGVVLIFISSDIILDNTLKLAQLLDMSTFIISLFIISLGTNLPEFTVGIRSILQKDKNIALGNYVGSATANTLLFGFLVLINPTGVYIKDEKFALTAGLIIVAILLFYIFTITKKVLSPKEGFILLGLYITFVVLEIGYTLSAEATT
ncbi:Inner membrane protein YrbG [Candidatus Brocadiaceae bacterium]|nr:sodium:calcium antiporter [Candidatus Dojkabacteria bacterium]CAG0938478.1 Inner membrane protein YrbG [Candidatus Brocadiaceae bacterium]